MADLLSQTTAGYYTTQSAFGKYRFVKLPDLIDQFMLMYVGEDKLIQKMRRADIGLHAKRVISEFNFDIFVSEKALEIVVPNTLTQPLPQDYVNYVKLTYTDDAGVEHVIYPARVTSHPQKFNNDLSSAAITNNPTTWDRYQAHTPNAIAENYYDYDDDNPYAHTQGARFGIDPQHAQINGSWYINYNEGLIHFTSALASRVVTIKYISDGMGSDDDMHVHKLAEDAVYKSIAHSILSTKAATPEYIIQRFKKESFAAKRKAKLRLSNIKTEEIAQIMRGKSKQIKH